ncbi:calcium channel flower homolog isoform X2 [Saccoglossus kowalevskii]
MNSSVGEFSDNPGTTEMQVDESTTPPPQKQQQDQQVSWWFRILVRVIGTLSGLLCMVFGLWRCVTFTPLCLVAGLLMILLGFIVVIFEAPICCQWLEFVDKITNWVDGKPYWQRGVAYVVSAIIPMLFCFSLTTMLGSGFVFVTGSLYGLMAIGKKGDAIQVAQMRKQEQFAMETRTLVDNQEEMA